MVDRRSTSLPECGPTEYPAPEPCFTYVVTNYLLMHSNYYYEIIWHVLLVPDIDDLEFSNEY